MNTKKFMELLGNSKIDENGNLYVENKDIKGPLLNSGKDDGYDHTRWYFSLSSTVCYDLAKEYCQKEKYGYTLYDRHFLNDDTLEIILANDYKEEI